MKIIDLSHSIHPNIPVYPGTEQPVITQANTIDRDGFAEKDKSFPIDRLEGLCLTYPYYASNVNRT